MRGRGLAITHAGWKHAVRDAEAGSGCVGWHCGGAVTSRAAFFRALGCSDMVEEGTLTK